MPIPKRSFYFLRHGQTDWNAEGRFQGHADVPLNEVGLAQAELAPRDVRSGVTGRDAVRDEHDAVVVALGTREPGGVEPTGIHGAQVGRQLAERLLAEGVAVS